MEKFVIGEDDISNYTHILDSAVEQNADIISMSVDKQVNGESVSTILNTYIDHLLALMLRDYDKERLLEVISSGVYITLRSVLEDKLLNNKMIKDSIENKKELAI